MVHDHILAGAARVPGVHDLGETMSALSLSADLTLSALSLSADPILSFLHYPHLPILPCLSALSSADLTISVVLVV